MDIIRINRDILPEFELIITQEGLEGLNKNARSTFALGAVEDGMPVGAAVVSMEPPYGKIISLYVVEEYRKQGIGTALCGSLIHEIVANTEMEALTAFFVEEPDGDVFKSFFEHSFFTLESVGADYTISVGEAIAAMDEEGIGEVEETVLPYNKLNSKEKRLLLDEEADVSEYIRAGQLREDLSFFLLDGSGSSIKSCIVFAEVDDELVIVWARTSSGILLMEVAGAVKNRLGLVESARKMIHIPAINKNSTKLIRNMFGTNLKQINESYMATF